MLATRIDSNLIDPSQLVVQQDKPETAFRSCPCRECYKAAQQYRAENKVSAREKLKSLINDLQLKYLSTGGKKTALRRFLYRPPSTGIEIDIRSIHFDFPRSYQRGSNPENKPSSCPYANQRRAGCSLHSGSSGTPGHLAPRRSSRRERTRWKMTWSRGGQGRSRGKKRGRAIWSS